MTLPIAIFDIDIMIKLIACDVWEETIAAYNITTIYKLNSAVNRSLCTKLKQINSKRIQVDNNLCFAENEIELISNRINQYLSETKPILPNWIKDAQLKKQELMAKEIDVGEAEATALLLAENDINLLLSGDKRYFDTLKREFPEEYQQLASKKCLISNGVFRFTKPE